IYFIIDHVSNIDSSLKMDHLTIDNYQKVPKELFDISILYHHKVKSSHVYGSRGGIVPDLSEEMLLSIIDNKNQSLLNYDKLDENWLVIGEGLSYASQFDRIGTIDVSNINSGFDKIFVVRVFEKQVVQIK
ncbi:MAG: hypothetical protein AAFX87_20670, partial [Bacteroidota bacterium]